MKKNVEMDLKYLIIIYQCSLSTSYLQEIWKDKNQTGGQYLVIYLNTDKKTS